MFFERKEALKRNVATRQPARDVIRMKKNWGGVVLSSKVMMSSGTHQGLERQGQPSAAFGCLVGSDKPVVLFGSPANI